MATNHNFRIKNGLEVGGTVIVSSDGVMTIPTTSVGATQAGGTNNTRLATTAFVQQEITTLIGGAPSTLNDLNELAAAINDDASYASTLTTALGTKLPLAGGTLTGALIAPSLQLGGDANPTLTGNGIYLKITTSNGELDLGAGNTSYLHITTDRPQFYFNKKIVVNEGIVRSYDQDLQLDRAGSTTARLRITAGTTISDQKLEVDGDTVTTRLLVGDGTDGVFYSDTAGRTAFNSGDFYIQTGVTNYYNYATNQYHGYTSGDNHFFRGNALSGDNWSITAAGVITATGGNSTQWNTAYTYSQVGHLPLAGGTLTGNLIGTTANFTGNVALGNSGTSNSLIVGGSYGKKYWTRAYVVSTSTIGELVNEDGTSLATGGAYRFTGHIDGTGTDQSSRAVFWNENGTWNVNVTGQSGTSSNHIQFLVSGGVPSVKTYHASNYTVRVWHERINLNENAGTDNSEHYFGADAYLSKIGDNLSTNSAFTVPSLTSNGSITSVGTITITGGNLNLRNNTTGDGSTIRDINFYTTAAEGTTDDRVAIIRAQNEGGTGTSRGGRIKFYTRQTNSGSFNTALTLDNVGNAIVARYLYFTGELHGNSKKIFSTGDTYLRMNQSSEFSSGIYIGSSNLLTSSGYIAAGSNGGTTNSRVYIKSGSYNGTNVIAIDGTAGTITTASNIQTTAGYLKLTSHNHIISSGGANNLKITTGATGASGILLENTGGNFMSQIYGDGTYYGFLDGAWAAWDIKKTTNGQLQIDEGSGLVKVWTAGNDGSGSGLDADTVDGIQGASFLRSDATDVATGKITLQYGETSDLNSVGGSRGVTAFHTANVGGTSNRPDTGNYATGLEFTYYDSSARSQLAAGSGGSNNTAAFYVRSEAWSATNSWTSWYKLWHTGNDGAGSTLDADLLDGQHGSYYAPVSSSTAGVAHGYLALGQLTSAMDTTNLDLDIVGNASIRAGSYLYFGITTNNHSSWKTRIGSANSSTMYIHAQGININNTGYGTVVNWLTANASTFSHKGNTIWHAGNDGSGSGLDADLLDGQHGSYYAPASHVHSYLPLAGGTMTGTITGRDIKLQAGYHLQRSDHHSGHLEGSYNNVGAHSAKSNPIYTIGSSYNPTDAALSNMYGIGYSHSDASFYGGTGVSGWGMYVAADGDARVFLGGSNGVISSTGQHYVGSNVVWNAGNDGSGSGLDADLLDGQNSSYYYSSANPPPTYSKYLRSDTNDFMSGQLSGGFGAVTTSGTTNWNDSTNARSGSGYTLLYGNATNGPGQYAGSSYYHPFSFEYSSKNGTGNMTQFAIPYTGNGFALRSRYSGTWSGWVKIWNAGNDGSGSGLDADLLDGQNGAYYYSSANPPPTYSKYLRSDQDDTVTAGTTYTFPASDSPAIISIRGNGGASLYVGGWSGGANSNNIHRISSSSNLHIDSAANGDLYLNYYRGGTTYIGGLNVAWHAGNDGSGSTLDADLLDGVQGANYARLDQSNVFGAGTHSNYFRRNNTTNYTDAPLLVESYGGSSTTAGVGFHISGSVGRYLFMNSSANLFWNSTSSKIWHASNDGSGSGLDADLLDGQHASAFLTGNQTITLSGPVTGSGTTSISTSNPYQTSVTFQGSNGNSPDSAMEYTQASGVSDGRLAPSTDWYNKIRMGHGDPYNYYGNTIAVKMTGTGYGDLYTMTVSNNSTGNWNKHWHANNDGSGSGLDADLLDGQHGSYYAPNASLGNYVLKNGHTSLGAAWKTTFYSGSGGVSFAANHYSMGVDYANGSWSGPNYSDLIIGYHTGIRIGAAYGGVKFYNNSPTTDANNDGEGDGTEDLIMTVAGANGGSGVKIENYLKMGGSGTMQTIDTTTHSLEIKNSGSTSSGGLVLQGSDGTHGLQLYWDGSGANYGFLDAAWASWDIQKVRNSTFKVDEGSGLQRVWNAGNDGSGSGLDADLLDGQHGSYYLPTTGKAADSELLDGIDSSRVIYGTNATGTYNANPTVTSSPYQKSGFYDVNSSSNNAPTNTYYSYINMRHTNTANNHGHQIAGSFYSQGDLYNRQINNNSYGSWSKIWNTTNDGSGSGLDADLLDGLNLHNTQGTQNTANTVLRTQANGYTMLGWINTTSGTASGTISRIYCSQDGYIRYLSPASLAPSLANVASALQIYTTQTAGTAGVHYPTFVSVNSSGNKSLKYDPGMMYDPSTNILGDVNFKLKGTLTGSLVGNASTVTQNHSDGNGSYPILWKSGSTTYYTDEVYINASTNSIQAYKHICEAGTDNGIGFWGGHSSYAIKMGDNQTNHGTVTDYSMHFNMGATSGRGFTFGSSRTAVTCSINALTGAIVSSNNITAYSDIRVKDNIEVIPNALDKVKQLSGYTFTRTDVEDKEQKYTGVIAQEVLKVLPEAVQLGATEEDTISVAYGNMVGLLIESIKELKAEVDDLKTQLSQKEN